MSNGGKERKRFCVKGSNGLGNFNNSWKRQAAIQQQPVLKCAELKNAGDDIFNVPSDVEFFRIDVPEEIRREFGWG
jgi:hypothetical protein